jgi:hypothetical protein
MSLEAQSDPVHYSDWLTLLGFMPEQEALQYVKSQMYDASINEATWLAQIRKANELVAGISNRADLRPDVMELGAEFQDRTKQLESEPTFNEHMIGMKTKRFAFVEASKLHCFQIHLNSEYIDSLVKSAPRPDDREGLVKFSLPTMSEKTKTKILTSFNQTSNTFSAITENLDFRITGNVQGEDSLTGRRFSGFQYGFGLPQLSVVDYKGSLLIKNGYHRAYALFKKGHKYIPCLLLSTDSFQFTGAQAPGFFPIDLIMSNKSPILSDFETPAAVPVPRRRLRLMVSIHAEVQVVPL